jgi:hypothetical protein
MYKDMKKIVEVFEEHFSQWNIRLPPEVVEGRKRGRLFKDGWVIWYFFGSAEEGEYLDYYAIHRITDDLHVRIYVDGRCKNLPALCSIIILSGDPEEDALREAEYYAENKKISKMLKEKGFLGAED